MRHVTAFALAGLALAGCTTAADPPIGFGPIPGAYRPPPSGSFCENYADQTARNQFEKVYDSGDSFGADAFNVQRARRSGDAAYQRCIAGRTN